MPKKQTVLFNYRENWSKGLKLWERIALLFQHVTVTTDSGHFVAVKVWRGKIYIIAESVDA